MFEIQGIQKKSRVNLSLSSSPSEKDSNTQNKVATIDPNLDKERDDLLLNTRLKNPTRLIFAHLNINSLRNKFEFLKDKISSYLDIFLISETKLDSSFPTSQFCINGFSTPFRLDRTNNGGGLLLYVRNHVPCKVLNAFENLENFEHMFLELNLNAKKWLLSCSYNPNSNSIAHHLDHVSKGLDYYSSKYDNFILLGDYNAQVDNDFVKEFCSTYNLKSLIRQNTCFKSLINPSCIDLVLTNCPKSFQHSGVYETGLSDFHKLTFTVLKTSFQKLKPRIIKYRDYKKFDNLLFASDLERELSLHQNNGQNDGQFSTFKSIADKVVNHHVPLKEKHIRGNQGSFMNKNLKKAMMTRSRLLNKYRKQNSNENYLAYKRQRNYCLQQLRKTKKDFYNNLKINQVTDNKVFWKVVKPSFSDKVIKNNNIILVENDQIISKEVELAEVFNNYFGNIVKNLNIESRELKNLDIDPVINAIKNYQNHPSIKKIEASLEQKETFSFNLSSFDNVFEEIKKLDNSKTSQQSDIPTKIIKQNINIFTQFLHTSYNNMLEFSIFPNEMKNADVIPIYKKDSRSDKENYRPVSILPNISKVFERLLFKQLYNHFENILYKNQFGFRKGYSTQQCLITMIEKLRHCIDQGGICGMLLTDLSKAFDCLSHNLLIAKLHAYGMSLTSLKLVFSYLNNRYQRVKMNGTYSSFTKICYGVPQGSILGPLLFNIFLNDLFMFLPSNNVISYADDNTPFCIGKDSVEVLSSLEETSKILLDWFQINSMKANPDKCHFLISDVEDHEILIGDILVQNSESEKLLGIKLDRHLNFDSHIENLCKKASQKVNALSRIAPLMKFEQRRLIMNSFINSHFSYCPIVWMFHSKKIDNRINRIQERALRIVYQDYSSCFEDLLQKDNSLTNHQRNIQKLATEIFKVTIGNAPKLMEEVFDIVDIPYNLRNQTKFKSYPVKTVKYGLETVSYLGPKVWNLVPDNLKNLTTLSDFKTQIKKWVPINCPCKLCKNYISHIGYV